MARPAHLKVGPIRYKLAMRADMELDEKEGMLDEARQTLHISAGLGADIERETTLHEALHAALAQTAFRHNLESEEELVSSLAPILLSLLRDNPDWVAWLCQT